MRLWCRSSFRDAERLLVRHQIALLIVQPHEPGERDARTFGLVRWLRRLRRLLPLKGHTRGRARPPIAICIDPDALVEPATLLAVRCADHILFGPMDSAIHGALDFVANVPSVDVYKPR